MRKESKGDGKKDKQGKKELSWKKLSFQARKLGYRPLILTI